MAERGANDKSNKTLRSYLVYDYILKKTTTDTFQIGKLNAYLEAYGIKCDNRAIMRDIEAINQAFIMLENELSDAEEANELLQKQENQLVMRYDNWGGYRINRQLMDRQDFFMIAECIGAARFINAAETENLIDILGRFLQSKDIQKIKKSVANVQREKSSGSLFCSNFKNINDMVNRIIDDDYHDMMEFDYLTYDIDLIGKPLSKQKKEHYFVYPHKIINCNGLYYLVAYDCKKRKFCYFRIDRMTDVNVYYDENFRGKRLVEKIDFSTLTARTFDMCMGESTRVTIQCANTLFDTIFERFGMDGVSYHKCDDKHFEVSLVLEVSPKFFGWLCGFGKDAKLVSPPAVVEQFASYLDEIKSQY